MLTIFIQTHIPRPTSKRKGRKNKMLTYIGKEGRKETRNGVRWGVEVFKRVSISANYLEKKNCTNEKKIVVKTHKHTRPKKKRKYALLFRSTQKSPKRW